MAPPFWSPLGNSPSLPALNDALLRSPIKRETSDVRVTMLQICLVITVTASSNKSEKAEGFGLCSFCSGVKRLETQKAPKIQDLNKSPLWMNP